MNQYPTESFSILLVDYIYIIKLQCTEVFDTTLSEKYVKISGLMASYIYNFSPTPIGS